MSITKIKLIDSLGQEFELPKTFELRSDPGGRRTQALETAFIHGAKDVSDGMFRPKVIEISGRIWASSDTEFNTKWDPFMEHLIKENVRIQDKGRQIYIKRVLEVNKEYPSPANFHFGEISIAMLAEDPFWYSLNAQQKQEAVTETPHEFQFDIGGKMETWPVIIIDNNADNTNFTLRNITDNNRELRIQDSGAVNGTIITIDCKEGTVIRNSVNIIPVFSGLFLRLLGGQTNYFRYTGANCDITLQYFSVWI
jgi:hypothetical protein